MICEHHAEKASCAICASVHQFKLEVLRANGWPMNDSPLPAAPASPASPIVPTFADLLIVQNDAMPDDMCAAIIRDNGGKIIQASILRLPPTTPKG